MSTVTVPIGTSVCHLPNEFTLEHGGVLRGATLAFELSGAKDLPLVVALGGISAGRHVVRTASDPSVGWWEGLVGSELGIDTSCYRVLGLDFLGGAGGSSGPGNTAVRPFPRVTSIDQARALAHLLDELGLDRVHAIVGASFGGMVALAFAAEYPTRCGRAVAISAADCSHPLATAWRSVQRDIARLGQRCGEESGAVAIARGLAMATYRSAEEFGQRFASDPVPSCDGVARFPVEEYLGARGEAFAERYTADEFITLSEAIDLHRVDPARVRTPVTLIGARSDQLVPIAQLRNLASRCAGPCQLIEIDSLYGHDAFLKEFDALNSIVADALTREEVCHG